MNKLVIILISSLLLLGCSKKVERKKSEQISFVEGQSFPDTYLSPSNISWSDKTLPEEIRSSKEVTEWMKDTYQDEIREWTYISLLDDKNQQVILKGSNFGSGGQGFLILTKTNKGWKTLTDIFGGFILYPVPSKTHKLVIYQKSGLEYFRSEFQFNGESYRKISSYQVPIELTRLNGSPIDFNKFFWFMNGQDRQ